MSTNEWYKQSGYNKSPFDDVYLEEFELSGERTNQELGILANFINHLPTKPRVVDIAGGIGRIGNRLNDMGLVKSMTIVDLNRNLLNMAKSHSASLVNADMRKLGFRDLSFDLALNMFTSFGYFENREDDYFVLSEVYRVLDRGGMFVLDLPNYTRILENFNFDRVLKLRNGNEIKYKKRVDNGLLIEERRLIKEDGVEEELLPIRLRIYFPNEILNLCFEAGFSKVNSFDQSMKEFSPGSSERLWVVGHKGVV